MRIEITSSEINGHEVRISPPTTSLEQLIKALHIVVSLISAKGINLEVKNIADQ